MQLAPFLRKNNKELFMISIIVLSSVLLSSTLRDESIRNILWHSDDAIHLSIAKSVSEGKGLQTTFAPLYGHTSVDELTHDFPTLSEPESGKGPIYYLILGGFLHLVSPKPSDFALVASLFNTIINAITLVVYFVFVRKYFGVNVAFLSSILLSFISITLWLSVEIVPIPLAELFIIISFLFLQKNKINYFLFGLFSGLAHLTHPIGVLPSLSYSLFLLFKKEFKGALIVFGTSLLLLVPWMVRNVFTLGSMLRFSDGLSIPFANKIAGFFYANTDTYSSTSGILPAQHLYDSLSSVYDTVLHVYNLDLILILSIISIVSIFFIQLMFRLQRKNKSHQITDDSGKLRLGTFALFYVFVSTSAMYYISSIVGWAPPVIYISSMFFILIPFAILALHRCSAILIKTWLTEVGSTRILKTELITVLVIGAILVSASGYELISSMSSIGGLLAENNIDNFVGSDKLNSWMIDNLPKESIVASDVPQIVSMRTGFTSVQIPLELNQTAFEDFMNNYSVSYLVFYGWDRDGYDYPNFYGNDLIHWNLFAYSYNSVYSFGDTHVIKLINRIDSASISEPVLYIRKAVQLEKTDQIKEANKIYDEVSNYEFNGVTSDDDVCEALTHYMKYSYSIVKCGNILKIDNTDSSALTNLMISYDHVGQREQISSILGQYVNLLSKSDNNSRILESWNKLVNYLLLSNPDYYGKSLLDVATTLEYLGKHDQALELYKKTENISDLAVSSLTSQIRLLTISKQYDEALSVYDEIIQSYASKPQTTDVQKVLVEIMKGKATLLTNIGRYDDANDAYVEIIRLDMFDKEAHEKRAYVLEKLGMPDDAKRELEFAQRLSGR